VNELHDRINQVINTEAFERTLQEKGIDLFEFQCTWHELSKGEFDNLPEGFKAAILAGEKELSSTEELTLA
jgi:hypothetical protein